MSGAVVVPAGGSGTLTYSAPPTWVWAAFTAPSGSADGSVAQVSATAPPGGQADTIPQATFIEGTVIYADSSAGSIGLQLLYRRSEPGT